MDDMLTDVGLFVDDNWSCLSVA